jgi:hypothetical protein
VRKLTPLVVLLTLVAMAMSPVGAEELPEDPLARCVPSHSGPTPSVSENSTTPTTSVPPDAMICAGRKTSETGSSSSATPSALPVATAPQQVTSGSSAPAVKYVPYNRLTTGADGQPCATTGYVPEGETPPDERLLIDPNPRESNIPVSGSDLGILSTYPPCPQQPQSPGPPGTTPQTPLETRSMVAARFWEQVSLPKPIPHVAPGRAITGKPGYLETRGELTRTFTDNTVFGPLQIVAVGSYTVDWGDGTTSGPHSFEGKAWPEGRITHDYLNVGRYNVVVTEKWTATWSLDGESGILRTLQTSGTITNFPVEQLQAVIGR